jgi:hypothetical protein
MTPAEIREYYERSARRLVRVLLVMFAVAIGLAAVFRACGGAR